MVQLVERKVRSRAKQLYQERGEVEGQDLQDWFQAESEVLEDSILAPLYRRVRAASQEQVSAEVERTAESPATDSPASESIS